MYCNLILIATFACNSIYEYKKGNEPLFERRRIMGHTIYDRLKEGQILASVFRTLGHFNCRPGFVDFNHTLLVTHCT